ncbi:fibronectin type 3 and ankyrin repeat domains 1-like isoform X1 [Octopus vulgaris]|uniref:Fibronectin type 3 and ankyrin repeat domains 1-like isoform X1 n=1 Tax=Octopus vulgaris TaxID=6645 RepID=A0AA36FCX4_OCTVU|nr:fibronectin type 3 and ankyrin repeat domains 1-like isoform X1 [Octopus vulgaris]
MSADKTEISEADVIASNHYSVHLDWSSSLLQFKYHILCDSERIYTILQQTEGTLEEENEWKNVYTGYGENTIVEDLKPYQEYLFRIRFHRSNNNYTNWSPPMKVITEKEPYYGENLHKAIRNRRFSEAENVLKSGSVKIDVPDNQGLSALMNTAKRGQIDIMEMLLSFNASVNGKDESGKTALMHACIHGQLPAVKMLLNNGALYNDFDLGGSSPLHYAVDSCKCELIEWMIKDGADVNIQDRNAGWTPLIRCASLSGKKLVALTLLHNGANTDLKDNNGKTCLMVAVINGHQQLVEVLLENNADITILNTSGRTAYEMAVSLEKRKIIDTMEKFMKKHGIKFF